MNLRVRNMYLWLLLNGRKGRHMYARFTSNRNIFLRFVLGEWKVENT